MITQWGLLPTIATFLQAMTTQGPSNMKWFLVSQVPTGWGLGKEREREREGGENGFARAGVKSRFEGQAVENFVVTKMNEPRLLSLMDGPGFDFFSQLPQLKFLT